MLSAVSWTQLPSHHSAALDFWPTSFLPAWLPVGTDHFKTAHFFFPSNKVLALAHVGSLVGEGPGPQTQLPAGGCGGGLATGKAQRQERPRPRAASHTGGPAPKDTRGVGWGAALDPPRKGSGWQALGHTS
jgi:hypothetical protein